MTGFHPPTSPLQRSVWVETPAVPRLGVWYVMTVPLFAAIAPLRGLEIGGFNYTGLLWTSGFAVGVMLLVRERLLRPENKCYFPALPWLLWMAYAAVSLLWTQRLSYIEIQDVAQLSMPVLVAMVASVFIRTSEDLAQVIRSFYHVVPILCAFVLLFSVGVLDQWDHVSEGEGGGGAAVSVRVIAYTAVVIAALAITGAKQNASRAWFGWGVCLALGVVTGSRMASAATLMLPIFNPLGLTPMKRVMVLAAIGAVSIGVFLTPTFQQRFFLGEEGGLDRLFSGDFDDAGRLEAWPVLYEEALNQPWFGHGMGSVQSFLPDIWPNSSPHAHNEYLRLGFELGVVGLVWFVALVIWQLWDLRRRIRTSEGVAQQTFAASWLCLAVFVPIAFTDNPLVLNLFYMDPLFALMGAAYTVSRTEAVSRSPRMIGTPVWRSQAVAWRPGSWQQGRLSGGSLPGGTE